MLKALGKFDAGDVLMYRSKNMNIAIEPLPVYFITFKRTSLPENVHIGRIT